jgi:hypothetical protein
MIFFQPFGVNNYNQTEEISEDFLFGISIFSVIAFITFFINEFFLKELLRNSILGEYTLLWYLSSSILIATILSMSASSQIIKALLPPNSSEATA